MFLCICNTFIGSNLNYKYNQVFFVLGVSLGCTRPLKKSLPKFDPGKLVNSHNFKMAAQKFSMYKYKFSCSI